MPFGKTALMPSKAVKTPTKKPARKTSKSAAKSTPKRETVASLGQSLKSLETRLKGADTKNRNALKALEAVVGDIKVAAKDSTKTQKAALAEGLHAVEARLESYLDRAASEARASVRSELAHVTAAGADLSTLEQAVQAAHERLDALDKAQRESLARLNRHIGHLAASVEQRLSRETMARKDASAALTAKIDTVHKSLETRITQVEQDAADALQVVGKKISEFADALEDRAKSSDADTAERLADLAQETQSDFSTVQIDVATRLEALEMLASTWSPPAPSGDPYLPANADDPRIDQMGQMIGALQDEVSRMHARVASVQNAPQMSAPSNVVPMLAETSYAQDNPYAAAARALEISAAEPAEPQPVIKTTPAAPTRNSHVPQEFDPTAFTTQPVPAAHHAPAPISAPVQAAPVQPALPPLPLPPVPPPMASAGAYPPPPLDSLTPTADRLHDEPIMPAPLPVATYGDPAYAEGDDMRAERIGGVSSPKPSLPKIPISGRNLRVGALAVSVAVVGLFAAKTVLGGSETSPVEANNAVPAIAPNQDFVQNAELVVPNEFGDQPIAAASREEYEETKLPTLVAGAQDTLDDAVKAGNPIAQFQKGLVQLQAGQMEEGARLIRLAANRNQPAAQYRLAKLYESGTGIAKDPITARELIERAARGGNRIAMHDLGNYHAYGQGGLSRDISEALDWFTKAAERGVVDSQFNVAFLREGNEGVPADAETALFWYFIAARQGDQGAPERIDLLSQELDAAAIASIQSRADRFNPKPVDEAANGIFRNVPWAKNSTQTAANGARTTPAQSAQILKIREAQTLLSALGYKVGTPDGISGSKTRDAVKSFEAVNGMDETGQITDELLQKLEIAAGV